MPEAKPGGFQRSLSERRGSAFPNGEGTGGSSSCGVGRMGRLLCAGEGFPPLGGMLAVRACVGPRVLFPAGRGDFFVGR